MNKIDYDILNREYDLIGQLNRDGIEIKRGKLRCPMPEHEDKNPSAWISQKAGKARVSCGKCGYTYDILDYMQYAHGKSHVDLWNDLGPNVKPAPIKPAAPPKVIEGVETFKDMPLEDKYAYTDQHGTILYFAKRYSDGDKKTFLQMKVVDGKEVGGMDGVQRVLFRLRDVMASDEVIICEGEKCVQAWEDIGRVATCNAGGSNQWLGAYAEYLRDKDVIVNPDNDEPGAKWLEAVMSSLKNVAKTVAVYRCPTEYNDFADMLDDGKGDEAHDHINSLKRLPRGVYVPIVSMSEMAGKYIKHAKENRNGLPLSQIFPQINRGLMPGDLVTLMADTGTGKTFVLQNLAVSLAPHKGLFFELELSDEMMMERYMQITQGISDAKALNMAAKGNVDVSRMDHVYGVEGDVVKIDQIEPIIKQSELIMGRRAEFVIIDYIGLVKGDKGGSRYEVMSNIAETLKVIARGTGVPIIASCQVKRDESRDLIGLHDAKDSGSIENSSQLVIGLTRKDETTIVSQVLKDTKGSSHYQPVTHRHDHTLRLRPELGGGDAPFGE